MRALVYRGTKLTLEHDYPHPTPAAGEALIRVRQVGICNTDLEITHGYMGFQGVLGHEFVGIVEEIYGDTALRQYRHLLGQRVVGEINAACHHTDCFYCQRDIPTHCPNRTTLGIVNRDGTFADYVMLPTENLHIVPENVSDEEAVFVEPLAANFEIFEQVHLKPTQRVIIIGDGKMGQLAAQVLRLSGCEILMVGKHKDKLALVENLGVTTHHLKETEHFVSENRQCADLIVECSGSAQGLELATRLVQPRGTIVLKSTVADKSTLHLAPIVIDEIRIQGSRCGPFPPALRIIGQKLVNVSSLISARYTLDEGLAAFDRAAQKGVLKILVKIS